MLFIRLINSPIKKKKMKYTFKRGSLNETNFSKNKFRISNKKKRNIFIKKKILLKFFYEIGNKYTKTVKNI